MSDQSAFIEEILYNPELVTQLTQAGLYFSHQHYDKAEPLFRSIPKSFPKYALAVLGLFNVLWAKNTRSARREAMQLVEQFLDEADRTDIESKPVVAHFLKIKIQLLRENLWDLDI